MKEKNNEGYEIEIDLTKAVKNKTFLKALALMSVLVVTISATYVFADKYTLNFRSPILFQNPVIVQERIKLLAPQIEVVEEPEKIEEATDSAETSSTQTYGEFMSSRLIQHIEARPDVWEEIQKQFGEDHILAGELIARESSFIPTKINSSSGACGLGQALPCRKLPCELAETKESIQCQLNWVDEYIAARYGTVAKAIAFHDDKGWY